MALLPFVIQIAFFGAGGASFILAHLKNQAARDMAAGDHARRWRLWRHPHLTARDTPSALALKRAAVLQSAWGFVYLGAAVATPYVFRFFHIAA
jgi:hypothetical protein